MAMAMPTAEKVYGEIVTTACDHELDGPAITAPYVGSGLCFCGSTRFTEKIDGECLEKFYLHPIILSIHPISHTSCLHPHLSNGV